MLIVALFIAVYGTERTKLRSAEPQTAFLEEGVMEIVHDQFQYNSSDQRSYEMVNTPPPLIDVDAQNDIYYSLLGMMLHVQSTWAIVNEWMRYVAECVESGDCLVIEAMITCVFNS